MLKTSEQIWLLQYARHNIACILGKEDALEINAPEGCQNTAGCFVTIYKKEEHELRGCIGTFDFNRPLYANIADMAKAAATRDPRFSPLRESEFDEIELEISVLEAPTPCATQDIVVGKHGLLIEQGSRRGVLLPQVASDYGWNREQFLDHTCLKAGLPRNAWQNPNTQIHCFEAHILAEKELLP